MFCPDAVVWGDVASWVSGLGALIAVIVALYIAGAERRAAQRARADALDLELKQRSLVIEEAKRLASGVHQLAASYVQLVKFGGGDGIGRKVDLLDDIEGHQRQLEALQQFPTTDPRLFAEIGRIAYECRVEAGLPDKSTSYAELTMQRIVDRMSKRLEALDELGRD